MACGASGIITEPYTDYIRLALRHMDIVLAGEGDNIVLIRNDRDDILSMVKSMLETAGMKGGYLMSIGNHIPWNVPPEAIRFYLDTASEMAYRN